MESFWSKAKEWSSKDRDKLSWLTVLVMFTCIPEMELRRDSLNKPWTEAQQHKILLTTVGKIPLTISCLELIPSRANNANLTEGVPAKHSWSLVKMSNQRLREIGIKRPFKKKNLEISSPKSSNVSVQPETSAFWTA